MCVFSVASLSRVKTQSTSTSSELQSGHFFQELWLNTSIFSCFRSCESVKSVVIPASYFKPFVNIAKDDLKVVTVSVPPTIIIQAMVSIFLYLQRSFEVFKAAPSMPQGINQRACFVCRAPHTEHKEASNLNLFLLS